jgi:hypothetical protein
MSYSSSTASADVASYGGFVDALGGIATIVLAIIALAGVKPEILVAIATVVFGAPLLIQGGAMLTEFALIETTPESGSRSTGDGLSALFLVGIAYRARRAGTARRPRAGFDRGVGDSVRCGAGHFKLGGLATSDIALDRGAIPGTEPDVAGNGV